MDEHWIILPDELKLIREIQRHNQLAFAVMFKFFQLEGRYPKTKDIPKVASRFIAKQLNFHIKTLRCMIGTAAALCGIEYKFVNFLVLAFLPQKMKIS